jgi:hypothetical protein
VRKGHYLMPHAVPQSGLGVVRLEAGAWTDAPPATPSPSMPGVSPFEG